uniref:Activin types I and II receptor domain-containing protein n=1 Tax=Anopheles atroparvus TaxID=41427 RepID=A0AAG5D4W3_ANOAO
MNYINVLSILTAFLWIMAVQLVDARKCYICGEGADGPFKTLPTHGGQSSVPTVEGTCEDFRPEEKYAFDCPPTYTSCLTQVDGDIETRTCGESLAINDCKSANNIDYCYCSEDLCNRLTRVEIRRSIETALMPAHHRNRLGGMHHHEPPNNSDDEDMLESSGMDGDRSESQRTLQHHHRDMLHNEGIAVAAAPTHRDVTTQITITLKPVATSTDRRSKDSTETGVDGNRTDPGESRKASNAVGSSSTVVDPIPRVWFSCVAVLSALSWFLINGQY